MPGHARCELRIGAALLLVVASGMASASVRASVLCADIESQPMLAPSRGCYVGIPCLIGVRGMSIDTAHEAGVMSRAGGRETRVAILGQGRGAAPAISCVASTSNIDEGWLLVRTPVLERAGPHVLSVRRPALLGLREEESRIPFDVVESHAFLWPRQAAASEVARQGEPRVFTFTGRRLSSLRVRADAPVVRDAAASETAVVVQWIDPAQAGIRIRLTLQRAGVISTQELFEFEDASGSPVNRAFGWPVIRVAPAH